MQKVDCLIVGGGIVGVAVARNLQSALSHLKCLLVEKEDILGEEKNLNSMKIYFFSNFS
jgi:L-2-hydroxyglutarate oxidase LhgO